VARIIPALALLLLAGATATAGLQAPARVEDSQYKNAIGFGISAGWLEEGNGHSWGLSVDYSRLVAERWAVSGLVSFDRFYETPPDSPSTSVETMTVGITGSTPSARVSPSPAASARSSWTMPRAAWASPTATW
jgi:hypothetical protein